MQIDTGAASAAGRPARGQRFAVAAMVALCMAIPLAFLAPSGSGAAGLRRGSHRRQRAFSPRADWVVTLAASTTRDAILALAIRSAARWRPR